jgi:tRNA 2-selenouridine synthase
MSLWNDPKLQELFLKNTPLIDVRSPGEFLDGSIPNSINLPIMNDEERHLVGTCYKEQGQDAAIELGYKLVSGNKMEERIALWREAIQRKPETEVFCFRGGLRSQIACEWINMDKRPVMGGYKRMRKFFLSWLEEAPLPELLRIGGPTGSWKTDFIKHVTHIDIEKLANHRGSAFGNLGPQPSQITFENHLALELLRLSGKRIIVEDESATLGKNRIPQRLFQHLRQSPMLVLEVPLEKRIENIFESYVRGTGEDFFLTSLAKIQKALGGVNFVKIQGQMKEAFSQGEKLTHHEGWIRSLLVDYYDPIYNRDIARQGTLILKRGSGDELLRWFQEHGLR